MKIKITIMSVIIELMSIVLLPYSYKLMKDHKTVLTSLVVWFVSRCEWKFSVFWQKMIILVIPRANVM